MVFGAPLTFGVALSCCLMVARQVYVANLADDCQMRVARPFGVAIAICVIGTLVIGIFPRPVVALGKKAATVPHVPGRDSSKHSVALWAVVW